MLQSRNSIWHINKTAKKLIGTITITGLCLIGFIFGPLLLFAKTKESFDDAAIPSANTVIFIGIGTIFVCCISIFNVFYLHPNEKKSKILIIISLILFILFMIMIAYGIYGYSKGGVMVQRI